MVFVDTQATTSDNSRRTGKHLRPETEKALALSRRKAQTQQRCATESLAFKTADDIKLESASLKGYFSLSAQYRRQLLSTFLSSYVPENILGMIDGKPWYTLLPGIPNPTKALEVSSSAVCTAKLGRVHNDERLILESRALYVKALKHVQHALWDKSEMYKDETLAACMSLTMYELWECPGKSKEAYFSHYSGLSTLIRLRGPDAHTEGLAHYIFLTFRKQAVSLSPASNRTRAMLC